MRNPQTHKATASRAKRSIGLRSAVLFGVAALIIAGLAFLHWNQEAVRWPIVRGEIQGTRVIADHAVETKWVENSLGRRNTELFISSRAASTPYGLTLASEAKAK